MRSRRDDVDLEATIDRAKALGLCGFGGAKNPDDRLARRIARFAEVAAVWPDRVKALVPVSGYLIVNLVANQRPLSPQAEHGWWYQYYFATQRGIDGYRENAHDFNKLIWQEASPTWKFDDATYDRSAAAFTNSDHVDIVIHNCG